MPTNGSVVDTFLSGNGLAKNVTLETRDRALLSYGVPIAVFSRAGVLSVLGEAFAKQRSRTTEQHVALLWARLAQRSRSYIVKSESVTDTVLDLLVVEECHPVLPFRTWDGKKLPYGQLSGKFTEAAEAVTELAAAAKVATIAADDLARANLIPPMTGESDVVVDTLDDALGVVGGCDLCIAVIGGSVYFAERLGRDTRRMVEARVAGDWLPKDGEDSGLLGALDELGFNTEPLTNALPEQLTVDGLVIVVQSNGDVRIN